MALTISSLGYAMRNAISGSKSVLAYCKQHFSSSQSVWYGYSGKRPPEKDNIPALSIIPWSKERGEDEDNRIWTYTIAGWIEDNTEEVGDIKIGTDTVKVRTGTGIQKLEEIFDLIMVEFKAMSSELFFDDKTMTFEPNEYWPTYVGELVLTVTFPILIGGYEPTL